MACKEELDTLKACGVYEIIDLLPGRKSIKNIWVFSQKSNGCKCACPTVKGFSQIEGINFDKIFSPVAQHEIVRTMLTLAALEGWHISGLDVCTAFLYGDLEEEIMDQPEGMPLIGDSQKVL
jgi:hypothetical protein